MALRREPCLVRGQLWGAAKRARASASTDSASRGTRAHALSPVRGTLARHGIGAADRSTGSLIGMLGSQTGSHHRRRSTGPVHRQGAAANELRTITSPSARSTPHSCPRRRHLECRPTPSSRSPSRMQDPTGMCSVRCKVKLECARSTRTGHEAPGAEGLVIKGLGQRYMSRARSWSIDCTNSVIGSPRRGAEPKIAACHVRPSGFIGT